jgi:tRNA threonylcarbamoyladenosine biosynthesis protein TsaE
MNYDFITKSPQQTIDLGRKFGSQLKGGEIIRLTGHLGSGKTHLIKGIASGAGAVEAEYVNSPTFVLVNEYPGRLDIYHIDAYRIENQSEFDSIGFDDYSYPDSVVLIEWADKIEKFLTGVTGITINLQACTETQRRIVFSDLPPYIIL